MIAIGSDHAGYELKERIKKYLNENNIDYEDFGTNSCESVDYPDFAQRVCSSITDNTHSKGILVCGTGIGMSIAANKVRGIRATVCNDLFTAKLSRSHNDSNVLCLGQRLIGEGLALEIVEIWLKTEFAGEKHKTRVDKITEIENK